MAAIIDLSTELDAPPESVFKAVATPQLLQHVCAPLMRFRPVAPASWPKRFAAGEHHVSLWLYGVLPLGRQVIDISFPEAAKGQWVIRDNGRSARIARWDHWIIITSIPEGRSHYTDRVEIEAGWRTGPVAAFARVFYAHRQRRLRRLAAAGFDFKAV